MKISKSKVKTPSVSTSVLFRRRSSGYRLVRSLQEQSATSQDLEDDKFAGLNAKLDRVVADVANMKAELAGVRPALQGLDELPSTVANMDQRLRVLSGRVSDLESSQRTAQLVGRYSPPPYVDDRAYRGAAFGEREKDRAPLSPYAE